MTVRLLNRNIRAQIKKVLSGSGNVLRNGLCFSCVSIELWMHLGSWESTPETTEEFGFASCHSNAYLLLSQLPKCIHNLIDRCTLSKDHFLKVQGARARAFFPPQLSKFPRFVRLERENWVALIHEQDHSGHNQFWELVQSVGLARLHKWKADLNKVLDRAKLETHAMNAGSLVWALMNSFLSFLNVNIKIVWKTLLFSLLR